MLGYDTISSMNSQIKEKPLQPIEDMVFLEKMKPFSRENIRDFVKNFFSGRNIGPLVDIASGYRTNEPEARTDDSLYVALDKAIFEFDKPTEKGASPNILSTAEHTPLASHYAGGVLCTEVLEHVADEMTVLTEIRRILKPGGLLVLTVPGRDVPFHGKEYQQDYRRFSHEYIKELLAQAGFQTILLENRFLDDKEINILIVAQ